MYAIFGSWFYNNITTLHVFTLRQIHNKVQPCVCTIPVKFKTIMKTHEN